MAAGTIIVPYTEFVTLTKDSADKAAVIELLKTTFPDDTCQLLAIKSVLGVGEDDTEDDSTDTTGTSDSSTTPTT